MRRRWSEAETLQLLSARAERYIPALRHLAMEYKKLGVSTRRSSISIRTIQSRSRYCYAYFQRVRFASSGDNENGQSQSTEAGIAAAKRAGDAHAQSELEACAVDDGMRSDMVDGVNISETPASGGGSIAGARRSGRRMSRVGLTGHYALPLNRRWVEIHRRKMPLRGSRSGA